MRPANTGGRRRAPRSPAVAPPPPLVDCRFPRPRTRWRVSLRRRVGVGVDADLGGARRGWAAGSTSGPPAATRCSPGCAAARAPRPPRPARPDRVASPRPCVWQLAMSSAVSTTPEAASSLTAPSLAGLHPQARPPAPHHRRQHRARRERRADRRHLADMAAHTDGALVAELSAGDDGAGADVDARTTLSTTTARSPTLDSSPTNRRPAALEQRAVPRRGALAHVHGADQVGGGGDEAGAGDRLAPELHARRRDRRCGRGCGAQRRSEERERRCEVGGGSWCAAVDGRSCGPQDGRPGVGQERAARRPLARAGTGTGMGGRIRCRTPFRLSRPRPACWRRRCRWRGRVASPPCRSRTTCRRAGRPARVLQRGSLGGRERHVCRVLSQQGRDGERDRQKTQGRGREAAPPLPAPCLRELSIISHQQSQTCPLRAVVPFHSSYLSLAYESSENWGLFSFFSGKWPHLPSRAATTRAAMPSQQVQVAARRGSTPTGAAGRRSAGGQAPPRPAGRVDAKALGTDRLRRMLGRGLLDGWQPETNQTRSSRRCRSSSVAPPSCRTRRPRRERPPRLAAGDGRARQAAAAETVRRRNVGQSLVAAFVEQDQGARPPSTAPSRAPPPSPATSRPTSTNSIVLHTAWVGDCAPSSACAPTGSWGRST